VYDMQKRQTDRQTDRKTDRQTDRQTSPFRLLPCASSSFASHLFLLIFLKLAKSVKISLQTNNFSNKTKDTYKKYTHTKIPFSTR
jgi:hypothetical protein